MEKEEVSKEEKRRLKKEQKEKAQKLIDEGLGYTEMVRLSKHVDA